MSDYVLADDLSGALETGAVFRQACPRVTIPLHPKAPADSGDGVEVLTSDTRGESSERAGEVVRSIITGRRATGSRLLLKKIDSTMRGPIGSELGVVLNELSPPLVALCPANPAVGRTVRDGTLFVHGVPLAESDFRNDPQWPAKSSRVAEILESQGVEVGARISLEELRNPGSGNGTLRISARQSPVVVFDAETDADLAAIFKLARRVAPGALFVGSAAFAAPLANVPAAGHPAAGTHGIPRLGTQLVVCGSGHPVSHRQLEFLKSSAGVRVLEFWIGETGEEDFVRETVSSLEMSGVAAVRMCTRGGRTPPNAVRLQKAAGRIVRAIMGRFVPSSLVLTGGETAGTVCQALGGVRLEVLGAIEPGVVVSRLEGTTGGGVVIVTKPGGYGREATLGAIIKAR